MKKLFFGLLIFSAISIFAVFVSCDSDKVVSSDRFVGTWIQNSLETEIVITTEGEFKINSVDEDFDGLSGTYVTTTTGATVLIDGIEEEYSLILLEKDVFKLELPQDLGGDAYFVKQRDVDLNFSGTWKNSDNSVIAKINDVNDSVVINFGTGSDLISQSGNFEDEDNTFIMFIDEENVNFEFYQEIGSGVISSSGKAYFFCINPEGIALSTVLVKSPN
jgi:hypothetical protein